MPIMSYRPSNHLSAALIGFLIFLTPCVLLIPEIFREDLGISNYGINRLTAAPYSLGFLTSAYCTWRAAGLLRQPRFGWGLRAVAILQLALLLVPDSRIDSIRHLHVGIGMTLFVIEFCLSAWLVSKIRHEFIDGAILSLQALAGLSAFFSLGQLLPFEAPSQLLFQIAFMGLCIRSARGLEQR